VRGALGGVSPPSIRICRAPPWKGNQGFLVRKAKMHSAVAPALPKFTFRVLVPHVGRQASSLPKTILEKGGVRIWVFLILMR
jgi:hypothetical protein